MVNIVNCAICGKIISSEHTWNPKNRSDDAANYHQFKSSDTVMCEECYKKYQKLFKLYREVK